MYHSYLLLKELNLLTIYKEIVNYLLQLKDVLAEMAARLHIGIMTQFVEYINI